MDLCWTLNFTASPENPEASEILPSFTIPLGGHTLQKGGHEEYLRAFSPSHKKAQQMPMDLDWYFKSCCFHHFLKCWQRRSHISRCEDPQLPAQTALEGRVGWKASVLCWLQHLQGATRGIKGSVSFLEKVINDHEMKKWFNTNNLLCSSCCVEMDSTKKSNTNHTVDLPHLIQCLSQNTVLWSFFCYCCFQLLFYIVSRNNIVLSLENYCFHLNITKPIQKMGRKPQSNSTHTFRGEII